jgi:hypothetical protein
MLMPAISDARSMDASIAARASETELSPMTTYDFTLRVALPALAPVSDELIDRLYEAGCDDALLGIGRVGQVAFDFAREAVSARDALVSAIRDVGRGAPGSILIEVSPDLVGMTDVAGLVGRSRQNIRKLLIGWDANLPIPVHSGSATVWHLADVLIWLRDHKGYDIDPGLLEVAKAAMTVNADNARLRIQREDVRPVESALIA